MCLKLIRINLRRCIHSAISLNGRRGERVQGWKLLSCSQCQELGQRANLAPDWLPENKGPIRSKVSSLIQLLT